MIGKGPPENRTEPVLTARAALPSPLFDERHSRRDGRSQQGSPLPRAKALFPVRPHPLANPCGSVRLTRSAPVDQAEPGVSIKSTWLSGGYNTISGTSMAAPHLVGILLSGAVVQSGNVASDPDGNPDRIGSR